MPRRDRSLFSSEQDFRSTQLLEELSLVVEALKMGFSTSTPFSTIMRSVGDFILLIRNFLEEGIPQNPSSHSIKILQDPKDPLVYEVDERMNVRSIRIPTDNPIIKTIQDEEIDDKLDEWLEKIIITFHALAVNPAADPNIMFDAKRVIGPTTQDERHEHKKLNHANFQYYARQRATRKSRGKDTKK